ncbi:isocitrate lyase/PEP mutase family protein [Salinarimonas chemoclinalis]|uniref:isocitrate lyase/PEP mutase family protein n=1 Tax=Salinarimonas chemoclinalis TaxID=3241599 RepID=UPI0035583F69
MPHDPGPEFRALHRPGDPFVLANAWDLGSARMLAALGAQALGTSSAAYAFTLGRPDMGHVSRDEMLAHAQALVSATPLPVSADLENGYGDAPEDVARTVRLACEAGLAGLSIEDVAPPDGAAYPFALAVERIRAGAAAARACPRDIVLLARADGVMTGVYDLEEGIRRLQAFADAGADGVYLPAPASMDDVARICASVAVPVNALAAGGFTRHSRADFAAAGVARISLGSALARATHRLIVDAAEAMLGPAGDFSPLSRSIAGTQVDALLAAGARVSPAS